VSIFGTRDRGMTIDELRAARVDAARRCQSWTEIDGPLVPRGPAWLRWFVHAESDRIYTPYVGTAFESGTATIVSDRAKIVFTVEGDKVTAYEAVTNPGTWTEHVRRKAMRT
jgi:hypothetical protein